ncbi:hypothetical protein EPTV-WA-189 [Eptesipox virus]|uniref:Uncharacterized protein n=1 Tax=Eptesipox virus TaxID=1329402 RepID=A0A220T673_9POXV|nr:hypothetical protein CG743_gp003 [Eptesipox virus]YP_009408140.1 hypothetical protein CG743_gp189 [Eptesipox virus]ASK51204.1 hypothetical protein EPTV-WA-003 [Eptesipox virus]ASK51390.1 hypothetical protein EPTV-WA-189 [Eptesipox virus]WAH70962.1 hypothetical protein CG743_gp003 [Eptesipox virus]WAH71148.1 hypothetical protein CG743_gp189 [Eptesipox virus]
MDVLTTFRIKAYLDELTPISLNEFIHLFKINTNFAKNDRDPSKEEIVYILQEEYSDCCIRLIYDIVNNISNADNIINMIKHEHKNINTINYSIKENLDYYYIDSIRDGIGIDDVIFSYFYWRRYKHKTPNKIFKEFTTYDQLALDYYKKEINEAIFAFNNGEKNYIIDINFNNMDTDSITLCKCAIGTIALLFDKVDYDINFETYFFNQVSIFTRLEFKKIIKRKYK